MLFQQMARSLPLRESYRSTRFCMRALRARAERTDGASAADLLNAKPEKFGYRHLRRERLFNQRVNRFGTACLRSLDHTSPSADPNHASVRASRPFLCRRPWQNLSITETVDEVIVHHADRLHVRINDRGADEAESPALEILAERIGFE